MPQPQHPNSLILQLYARAEAPLRDYYGLTIREDEVTLNTWNITYGPHVYPKRQKRTKEEFLEDRYFREHIYRTFGKHTVDFITSIYQSEKRVQNLPERVFLRILNHLATRDVVRLSQTSKILFELCNTDKVWKLMYKKYISSVLTKEELERVEGIGWKDAFRQKFKMTAAKKKPHGKKGTVLNNKIVQSKTETNLNVKDLPPKVKIINNLTKDNSKSTTNLTRTTALTKPNQPNKNNLEKTNPLSNRKTQSTINLTSRLLTAKRSQVNLQVDKKTTSSLIRLDSPFPNNARKDHARSVTDLQDNTNGTKSKSKLVNSGKTGNILIDIPKELEFSTALMKPSEKSKFKELVVQKALRTPRSLKTPVTPSTPATSKTVATPRTPKSAAAKH